MKRKTKQTVAIICTFILTVGLSSSALAASSFGDLNSQNRISFAGLDDTPGTEDDVLFDAGDFSIIENLVSNNIELMNENIVKKGGTLDGDMVENINSIPNILRTEYITAQDIQYIYHHHTVNSTSNDSLTSDGGAYADNYVSSTSTGCYTTPKYHSHTSACQCGGQLIVSKTDHGDSSSYCEVWCNKCHTCHQHAGAYGDQLSQFWYLNDHVGESIGTCTLYTCNKAGTVDGYTCGCGHRDGEIVAVDIIYGND